MTKVSLSEAKKKLSNLLAQTAQSHEPIHILGKQGGAVLISEDDWSAIQETLHLLSIPGMRESIRKGLNTLVSDCDEDLKW